MNLEIKQREREGIVILDLRGRLTLGPEDTWLREEVKKLRREGRARVILNLRKVGHLDTAGLGTLVLCRAALRQAGGDLVMLNLNPAHAGVLVVARLEGMFDTFQDEQDAVNSFFPNRRISRFDILSFVKDNSRKTS